MPQPTDAPAAFSPISIAASSPKETMTPSAVIARPTRTRPRSSPARLATDSNFSDSTGRTQGMTLRISPPNRATPRIAHSPDPARAGAPAAGAAASSAALGPSTRVNVSFRPTTAAASAPRSGTVRRAARPCSAISTAGLPGDPSARPSTNKSG